MSIFHAYDIRGVVPDEITVDTAHDIGAAFATSIQQHKGTAITLAVGQDNRATSPELTRAFIEGVRKTGAHVVDIGLTSTPFFYYTVSALSCDGGANITASHNPAQFNGFKLVQRNAVPIGSESGMQDIEKIFEEKKFNSSEQWGALTAQSLSGEYIAHNLSLVPPLDLTRLSVVVDPGNGVSALMCEELFSHIHPKLTKLFFELDGSFPNRPPDPLVVKNISKLCETVLREKAHVGIALDADGDRVVFVDEQGVPIQPDLMTALLSEEILKKTKGETILYDLRSSKIVPETIQKYGGIPIMTRVGHAFIKKDMHEHNALFAGECSGHYYFRLDTLGYFEAPLLVIVSVLNALASSGKQLSELIAPYRKYFQTGEVNFRVTDKAKILQNIGERFSDAPIKLTLDGITLDYGQWWFNLRPSNTENLLRLNLEAYTAQLRDEKLNELEKLITAS